MDTKKKKTVKKEEPKFSKKIWLESNAFSRIEKDFLSVALDDNKEYSFDEAKKAITKF